MIKLDPFEARERGLRIEPKGIFRDIRQSDLEALEQVGTWIEADGDLFIHDGCEHHYLYLVATGKVEVFKFNPDTRKRQSIAILGAGACLGEIAFLRGDVASANVKAIKRTVLWRIDHSCLQQYIAQYPGAAQFCLNLADTLAQRVQEGNTRLIGVTQSLSAYFGHIARQHEQGDIEAPISAGTADMEIPGYIYDRFVRESMQLDDNASVTAEQRQHIDALVKANELDFISWLEAGQRDHKLKVILKFLPLDERGEIIDFEKPKAPQNPRFVTPARNKPIYKIAETTSRQTSSSAASEEPPHIVSVPQVQARIKAHTAIIKEQPDRLWQVIHIAAYILLPFLTALVILKLLPLESRVGMSESSLYQAMPLSSSVVNRIIFNSSRYEETLLFEGDGGVVGGFDVPERGFFSLSFATQEPLKEDAHFYMKFYDFETLSVKVEDIYTLKAGEHEHFLTTVFLPPGKYKYEIEPRLHSENTPRRLSFYANGKH